MKLLKQVLIHNMTISLIKVQGSFLVRWRGERGKNQRNERVAQSLKEAEELFESWCALARKNHAIDEATSSLRG
jgi:hypothetical protein